MVFWDTVSTELKKAAVEGWEAVKAGTRVAAEKSEEVAKTGKLRYKAHTIHKQADKLFGQLGGIVYEMAEPPFDNPLLRADVQKLIEDIKKAEQEAVYIDEEVERVKKSASSGAADVPYYYETKDEAKSDAKPDESGEGDKDKKANDENAEPSGEADHACFSNCEGPCQCTEDTIVNSDLPEDDGDAVESHAYECPTDEDSTDEACDAEDDSSDDSGCSDDVDKDGDECDDDGNDKDCDSEKKD
jgi:hypothetical protein